MHLPHEHLPALSIIEELLNANIKKIAMEILAKDLAGRVAKIRIGKDIITPVMAVVVNPNKMPVTKETMKKMGVQMVITNAYIIKDKIEDVHDIWDVVYTDSGTYQMYSIGDVNITNEETIMYQQKIKSDIITPLDVFTLPTDDYDTAKRKLEETIRRIKYARENVKGLLNNPIQGGVYLDLRKEACKHFIGDIASIGGIVPLMEQYEFDKVIDIIVTCKKNLKTNVPVHAFGAGNPAVLGLLAAAGVDMFDSAAYALYADRGGYMTADRVMDIKEMEELPCNCPVCVSHTIDEIRKDKNLLAEHNLWVVMSEMKKVREMIRQGRLFEYVQNKARAHNGIYKGLKALLKHRDYLEMFDPIRKKHGIHYVGEESMMRPEITRALRWYRERISKIGPISGALRETFPFGQSEGFPIKIGKDVDDMTKIKTIARFQFGKGAEKFFYDTKIVKGRTGRIRRILKNNEHYATLRASDGYLVLSSNAAKDMMKIMKKVTVAEEAIPFVKQGKSVFAKFVVKSDEVYAGEQVVIIDEKGEYIATGDAVLNWKEMLDFTRGVAVKTR
ncbi:MAG TPA: tRNA guanosine(15) transglycosylase TgtA [Candidatus Aenigmarchaeota archaeon]|nr:MAG: tRNA guanosine(15) transglycosylase TgtA [Nanoarchaeota archaeon]HDO79904.1 tRNA guanosine(15) transglycosylase TgtA [Candidatus Aenigmarchaeota archaeon]HEX32956.1 tRNA guanosine(15) transglycosylase TgtA [Candidatus Aenigmarchaeota archaeon]